MKPFHDKTYKCVSTMARNVTPNIEWISDYQNIIGETNGRVKSNKYNSSNKLVPHLFKREKYVIHYRIYFVFLWLH